MQRDNHFPEFSLHDAKEELELELKFGNKLSNSKRKEIKDKIAEIDQKIQLQTGFNKPFAKPITDANLATLSNACEPSKEESYKQIIEELKKIIAELTDENNQLKQQLATSVEAKEKRKRKTTKAVKISA